VSQAESSWIHRTIGATVLALAVVFAAAALAAAPAQAERPPFSIGPVEQVSYDSAHLTGSVGPTKNLETPWKFQYSTDNENWQDLSEFRVPPNTTQSISYDLTGLNGGTQYFVRLAVADPFDLQWAYSAEPNPSFTTLPVAAPGPTSADGASAVSYTTATLSGKVERPSGNADPAFDVKCRFEYISDQQFEENVTNGGNGFDNAETIGCAENPVHADGVQTVSASVSGLRSSTTYHLRLTAQNAGGSTSDTAPNTFTSKTVPLAQVAIDPVGGVTATSAHFTGHITLGGTDPAFDVDWSFRCTPDCPGLSEKHIDAESAPAEVTVEANAAHLEPNTSYNVELIATNQGGPAASSQVTFKTVAVKPDASTLPAFVLEGGGEALLGARINPHNSETQYWFELEGPGGVQVVPDTEDAPAGDEGSAQVLSQKAQGLILGTTYHVRVIASNDVGTTEGESVPFTTPTAAPPESECPNKQFRTGPSAALTECRAFELVSSPDLKGYSARAAIAQLSSAKFSSVAADGESVLWSTDGIIPGVDSDGFWDTYLSHRTEDGWTYEFVSPPWLKTRARSAGINTALTYASPNLDRQVWRVENLSLDREGPERGSADPLIMDLIRREPDGTFVRLTRGPAEKSWDSSTRASLWRQYSWHQGVFSTDASFAAFGWEGAELVPGAEAAGGPPAIFEATSYVGDGRETTVIPDTISFAGISDDGGTVAYTSNKLLPRLMVLTDGLTRSIVVAETHILGSDGGFGVEPMTPDGSTVFYETREQETNDDTDSTQDLFEFDIASEEKRRISAPTGEPTGPGSGNEDSCPNSWDVTDQHPEGSCAARWVATSKDGAAVYFVSPELLDGEHGIAGEPNLYVRSDSTTTYVTTVEPSDAIFATAGNGYAARDVQLTPDQSKFIFQSRARVTAYDNHGFNEIYRYDPASGEIICASCRLDGSQPQGESLLRLNNSIETRAPKAPVAIPASDGSGDQIFFATYDSLRPGDTDQNSDVYSADLQHGAISALGNLTEDRDNYFWGASADGRDVFISSLSRLSGEEDSVGAYKTYDARVGGGFPPAPPPLAETCGGDDCHGSGSVPPAPLGSSTSRFNGPGDPPTRHKKPHKKKHRKHRSGKGKHNSKNHANTHRADGKGRNHR